MKIITNKKFINFVLIGSIILIWLIWLYIYFDESLYDPRTGLSVLHSGYKVYIPIIAIINTSLNLGLLHLVNRKK